MNKGMSIIGKKLTYINNYCTYLTAGVTVENTMENFIVADADWTNLAALYEYCTLASVKIIFRPLSLVLFGTDANVLDNYIAYDPTTNAAPINSNSWSDTGKNYRTLYRFN